MKASALLGAAVLLAMGVGTAQAAPIVFTTSLSGPAENPPNASPGTGTAIVTLDTFLHTLRVQVSFSGLLGTTTASHIHCCTAPPANVGVATQTPSFIGFPLGVTAGVADMTFDTTLDTTWNAPFLMANGGAAGAEAALASGLAAGLAYLNIHTNLFPPGEIRGFLAAIPEPASLALLAAGLVGLAASGRRTRHRADRSAA